MAPLLHPSQMGPRDVAKGDSKMDITEDAANTFDMSEGKAPYLRQIVLGRLSDFFRLEETLERLHEPDVTRDDADKLFIAMLDTCERLHQEPIYFAFYEVYLKAKRHKFMNRELDCKRLRRVLDEERLKYLKTLPICLSHFSQEGEKAS